MSNPEDEKPSPYDDYVESLIEQSKTNPEGAEESARQEIDRS